MKVVKVEGGRVWKKWNVLFLFLIPFWLLPFVFLLYFSGFTFSYLFFLSYVQHQYCFLFPVVICFICSALLCCRGGVGTLFGHLSTYRASGWTLRPRTRWVRLLIEQNEQTNNCWNNCPLLRNKLNNDCLTDWLLSWGVSSDCLTDNCLVS